MTQTTSSVHVIPFWRRRLTRMQTATGLTVSILLIGATALTAYYIKWRANPFLSGIAADTSEFRRHSPMPFPVGDNEFSLIPKEEIYAGGPPKDGIPALTNPKTVSAISSGLQPADRVIGVVIGGEPRAYPLRILNWHEIANDTLGGRDIAVTYCPLCDSAVVFDRNVDGEMREFGVSGLLYNSNVLMYDRQDSEDDESLWSQMLLKAVVGPAAQKGLRLEVLPAQLTTWAAWVARHPQTTSLSFETGHGRNYGENPYTQYFATSQLMFPVDALGEQPADFDTVPGKEPLLIVSLEDRLKGYPVSRLREALGTDATKLTDTFAGRTLIFEAVDEARTTFEVYDGDGNPVPVAFSFWFKFRMAHPDADVFEVPDGSLGASSMKEPQDFQQAVLQSPTPVLVKFEAEWCGICKALAPVVKEVANDRAETLNVVTVDIDAQPDIADRYNVTAIPDLILFQDGEPVRRRNGFMDRAALEEFLDVN